MRGKIDLPASQWPWSSRTGQQLTYELSIQPQPSTSSQAAHSDESTPPTITPNDNTSARDTNTGAPESDNTHTAPSNQNTTSTLTAENLHSLDVANGDAPTPLSALHDQVESTMSMSEMMRASLSQNPEVRETEWQAFFTRERAAEQTRKMSKQRRAMEKIHRWRDEVVQAFT